MHCRMHIHTSISFTLYYLLYLLSLYMSFNSPNIALMLLLLLMSNNISHFHSIMTSHHLPSILYLYLSSSNLCYYSSFTLLVLSYPIYMFTSVFMYFMHYHMHINANILFTLYYLMLLFSLYMLFHYSNIAQMLYYYLLSNNISLYLIMHFSHHLLTSLLMLYLPSSMLYYSYSLLLSVSSYLYS